MSPRKSSLNRNNFCLLFFLTFSLTAYAETSPPTELFHWTNSRRMEAYLPALERGEIPMKVSKPDRYGALDTFFAIHPHLIGTPALFTWRDVVGGMGSTKVEWYAKMELDKEIKPRLIVMEVKPGAKVLPVESVMTSGQLPPGFNLNPNLSLDGVDIVEHEFYQTSEKDPNKKYLWFREYIIVNPKAIAKVKHRWTDIVPYVDEGIRRLESGQEIEAISPSLDSSFRDKRSRDRALGVLQYIRFGPSAAPMCEDLYRGINDRGSGMFK